MAKLLPERLDLRRLTSAGEALAGEVDLRGMDRLGSMLVEEPGSASVELEFRRDELGRRLIEGRVAASVACTCQRCLETVRLALDRRFVLECVWGESQIEGMDRAHEPLLVDADEPVRTADLVEDELILALPPVALHDPDDRICRAPSYDAGESGVAAADPESGNPFGDLEKLRKGG